MRKQKMCFDSYKLIFILFYLLEGGVSLKNLTIYVPKAVISGDTAILSCSYELENTPLYSIRWYRDVIEFYRYVPREMPPTMVFPEALPGAQVNLEESDDHKVVLSNLHRQLSGVYQCEVSADAPLFHTDMKSSEMHVVDLPIIPPFLTIESTTFTRGDTITANCTTARSHPAPNITWYIDGNKVSTNYQSSTISSNQYEKQVTFSQLEITFMNSINNNNYDNFNQSYPSLIKPIRINMNTYNLPSISNDKVTIECVEKIYELHEARTSVVIKEDSPRPASVTGDNNASVRLTSLAMISLFVILRLFL